MTSIKKIAVAGLFACASTASIANATPITYQLNTVLGGTLTSSAASYGTVTYADGVNTNTVNVTIALNGSGQKIQEFIFNYNDTKCSNSTAFSLTGDVSTYSINENGTQADGYSAGKFDVQTPQNGNIGTQPITFNIALAGTNLDPGDFNFLDSSGKLYNAVHVGNCGTSTCQPNGLTNGDASIWLGSAPASTSVPEPASVALLGLGMIGTGVIARRRQANAAAG
jgi:PEP-CTERM motif-containing protein